MTSDTKEVKKHSSRLVAGVESARGKAADYMSRVGVADWETKDSKPLAVKHSGGGEAGRNCQSHRRVGWKVG